ncbi:hypothetical protein FOE78_19020 [Microlunatus elymi]|uniref:Uncharacterized protein n=1 Tax=Microlunatus elymi TaxID=2596828 RepID=A0A516Q2R3_9ACTN|nr:hypothetical protein [Microlunatus elymi]QDP97723.1 hypothetical protein FOE78_19020 [Microlunatus elymi]
MSDREHADLGEIDVQRINIREPDGRLRCVIASADRLPGLIMRGEEHPHHRPYAGMVFFNDEETENGGLIFNGQEGSSAGSLTFDGYEQDQIVQVRGVTEDGRQSAGLVVNDRPLDRSLVDDLPVLDRLPDLTPEQQEEATSQFPPGHFGSRRLFAGTEEGDSVLNLCDGQGRPRLRLRVGEDGSAGVEFLDAAGEIVKQIAP